MTTTTATIDNRRGFPWLLVLLIVAVALGAWTLITVERTSNHAFDKHGTDASLVMTACNQNGVYQFWMEPDKQTIHQLCDLGGGRFGDWIVVKDKGQVFEKTAFIPKGGDWNSILRWLANKGATRIIKPW